MEKITYYVTLSNRSCIFDSRDDFSSVAEALDWASGRGGTYNVGLTKMVDGIPQDYSPTISATHRGHKTTFAIQEIGGFWRNVTPEEIAAMI